jgi:hypothetical protein
VVEVVAVGAVRLTLLGALAVLVAVEQDLLVLLFQVMELLGL